MNGRRLIMLCGLPGVGKSRLADDLRTALPAVVLSVDPVEDALYRAGIDHGQPAGLAAYVVVEAMAKPALRAGQTVVIDAVNAAVEAREQWRALARRTDSRMVAIEVVCSDPVEHRRRLESRERGLPEIAEPAWASLAARRTELAAWTGPRLVLDCLDDPAINLARARAHLA